jgi:hypothetical protein
VAELSDYAWLTGDEAAGWFARLADDTRSELQQLSALRRELPSQRARLLVQQIDLRRRAVNKFGDMAARMFFTRTHLEQTTDLWIARYKASRLTRFGEHGIGDYCCGIGGDLLAFAETGRPVTGWDKSDIACLLAKANVPAAEIILADVENLQPREHEVWHMDPDRRADGRRGTALHKASPGPGFFDWWLVMNGSGCIKLAPAAVAPPDWSYGELEWITRDGECRQQVAWFGLVAGFKRRRGATIVAREGVVDMFVSDPGVPLTPAEEPLEYLYDPDPSILAGDLLGALATEMQLQSLGVGGAYLTGAQVRFSNFATPFRVRDCLPLRTTVIAKYCSEHAIGRVEIKKRGVATEPDWLRRRLRLRGDNTATLILARIGKREVAIVAERLDR